MYDDQNEHDGQDEGPDDLSPCQLTAEQLSEATPIDLMMYGLTLGEENAALGVLLGARRELGAIASLAECCHLGGDFEPTSMVPVLEGIGRRIDVALELLSRARRSTPQKRHLHGGERDAPEMT